MGAAKTHERDAPTATQVRVARSIVGWYLRLYFGSPEDTGTPSMYCDPARVGAFAIERRALREGRSRALFRLLVVTAMFQRRQDRQILDILRGVSPDDAAALTDSGRLLDLAKGSRCAYGRSTQALHGSCDLTKDGSGRGCCEARPKMACYLKRHTEILGRYGHFGKMPTSAALVLKEGGARDLNALRREVYRGARTRLARARALEERLTAIWGVGQKIACMYLSALTNPDLSRGMTPWARGLDWTHFVVVDSNVDLFLAAVGYRGGAGYDERRAFLQALAARIDLRRFSGRLRRYNPRLVQQALYLFMSAANRRASTRDCMHEGGRACRGCPKSLKALCPVRPG
jgi:hypothetical protein